MTELRAWIVRGTVVITDASDQAERASQPITSSRVGMLGWVDTLAEMGYVQTSPWVGTNEDYRGDAAQYCRVERSP